MNIEALKKREKQLHEELRSHEKELEECKEANNIALAKWHTNKITEIEIRLSEIGIAIGLAKA